MSNTADGAGRSTSGDRPWRPGELPIPEAPPPIRSGDPRRSRYVKLGLTAAVAGAGLWILWPADEPPTQAGVCVDRTTNTRVSDQDCEDDSSGHHHHGWYFIPFGFSAPRVGAPVSGGSFDTPRGTSYVTGGVDTRGGTISTSTVKGGKTTTVRGGFGGSGKSSGG